MSTHPQPTLVSPEEYLAFERQSEERHEYVGGEIFAMSGASLAHITIVANLMRDLGQHLRAVPCRPLSNDMRVRVSRSDYVYPDVVVVCGSPHLEDEHVDTLLNPTVIVEVLSPSTQDYDHGKKWMLYQQLPSLHEYLLVAQDQVLIERYTRQEEGTWLYRVTSDPATVLQLDSVGCSLAIGDVYDRVFA